MKRAGLVIAALGLFLSAQVVQAQWTPAKRLTWTSVDSFESAMAVDPTGILHVVWAENTPGNEDVHYKKSTDGGATWTTSQRHTFTSGNSWYPSIAADSSSILYVVWEDDTPGNSEINYRGSSDGGASWSTVQRLTWNSGSSSLPDVTTDSSGNVHVFWADDTPGNYEVYYKKGT